MSDFAKWTVNVPLDLAEEIERRATTIPRPSEKGWDPRRMRLLVDLLRAGLGMTPPARLTEDELALLDVYRELRDTDEQAAKLAAEVLHRISEFPDARPVFSAFAALLSPRKAAQGTRRARQHARRRA